MIKIRNNTVRGIIQYVGGQNATTWVPAGEYQVGEDVEITLGWPNAGERVTAVKITRGKREYLVHPRYVGR